MTTYIVLTLDGEFDSECRCTSLEAAGNMLRMTGHAPCVLTWEEGGKARVAVVDAKGRVRVRD